MKEKQLINLEKDKNNNKHELGLYIKKIMGFSSKMYL